MRHTILAAALLAATTIYSQAATLVAGWTFDALVDPVPLTIAADFGTGTIFLNGTNGASTWINVTGATRELDDFGGSLLGDPRPGLVAGTPIAGDSLSLANQTANGKSIVLQISTIGADDLYLSFVSQRTGTGFNSNSLAYSLDGIAYTPFESGYTPASSYSQKVYNLSAITALNNQTSVYLQYTVSGATSGTGNNRLDNVILTDGVPPDVIPEPTTALTLVSGLGVLGLLRRRTARA